MDDVWLLLACDATCWEQQQMQNGVAGLRRAANACRTAKRTCVPTSKPRYKAITFSDECVPSVHSDWLEVCARYRPTVGSCAQTALAATGANLTQFNRPSITGTVWTVSSVQGRLQLLPA